MTLSSPFHLDHPSQAHARLLSPEELLSTHVLPITTGQARAASVPKVQIQGLSSTALVRAAGNAMNLPCIGVVMLGIICGLEEL